MSKLLLFLCLLSFAIHAHALECGLGKHLQDDNVKNAFQICIANWTVVVVEKPIEPINTEPTNSTTEGTPSSSSSSSSSTTDATNKNLTNNANSTEKKLSKRGASEAQRNDANGNPDSGKCAVYCILNAMGLTDGLGYPDHNHIADTLTKFADEKELKDFYQDSIDECFQLQTQDKSDICQYANSLVSCLAEKARLNCGDWNFYLLSFA